MQHVKFEDYHIHPQIKKNLQKLGFKRPTDIQYKAIPAILKHEDLLAIAQTGTGKTAAYLIPILEHILAHKHKNPRQKIPCCLIMVPTHELAKQVGEFCRTLSYKLKIRVSEVYGGKSQQQQLDSLKTNNGIVIATPGRLFDLESRGKIRLDQIKFLILDEADKMLAQGFLKDIEYLLRLVPNDRQTLFISATIDGEIKRIAYRIVKQKAIRIELSPKNPVSNNVTHCYIDVSMDEKRFFLERIIKGNSDKKMLVFVRTKIRAERVVKAMGRAGIVVVALHGDKDQDRREEIITQFNKEEFQVLISTDVAARGLDFKDVKLVINYDVPDQTDNYVHRIGRTGRGRNKGLAYTFCSPEEKTQLKEIEKFIGYPLERIHLAKDEYEETKLVSDQLKPTLKDAMDIIFEQENFKAKKGKKKPKN